MLTDRTCKRENRADIQFYAYNLSSMHNWNIIVTLSHLYLYIFLLFRLSYGQHVHMDPEDESDRIPDSELNTVAEATIRRLHDTMVVFGDLDEYANR